MANADFCRTVLQQLKGQAEAAAKRHPQLRHMLVLPPGEGLLLPPRPGCRAPRVHNGKFDCITSFGSSQLVGKLPPIDCWPEGLPPLRAVVAEQDFVPFRPLAQEPYRIHLFFGRDKGMRAIEKLSESVMDLARDVDRALENCLGSIFWYSNDRLYTDKVVALDGWLCTLHWWAWRATDTPIFTKPKVVIGKRAFDCDRSDRALVERLSFSLVDCDIFAASAAMIDLIDRFFDAPPDLVWDVDYPCQNAEQMVQEAAERVDFKAGPMPDDPSLGTPDNTKAVQDALPSTAVVPTAPIRPQAANHRRPAKVVVVPGNWQFPGDYLEGDTIIQPEPTADAHEIKAKMEDNGKEHTPIVMPEHFVTLQQAAAMVNRSKRTLERGIRDMPLPRVQGAGGKPSEWAWSELRPWLEKEYERPLPARFPADLTDTDR